MESPCPAAIKNASATGSLSNSGTTSPMAPCSFIAFASAIGFAVILFTCASSTATVRHISASERNMFLNVDSNLAMCYYLPESFWCRVIIDKRRKGVHQQDGERYPLGIGPPEADGHGDEADPRAVNKHSFLCHGRCHVVRGHEDGSQHQSPREKVNEGVVHRYRVEQVQHPAKKGHGSQDRHRDMPGDDPFPEQVSQPQQ